MTLKKKLMVPWEQYRSTPLTILEIKEYIGDLKNGIW